MVGDQLVVATKPELLREVIDASTAEAAQSPPAAHVLLRLNRRGLKLAHDVRLYWSEKSRRACHRNISSNYNLCKLYGVPADKVSTLSEAKYGVRYSARTGERITSTTRGTRWPATSTATASSPARTRRRMPRPRSSGLWKRSTS